MKQSRRVSVLLLAAVLSACALDFGIEKRDAWPEVEEPRDTSDLLDGEHEWTEGRDPVADDAGEEAAAEADTAEDDTVEEEVIVPPTCGDGDVDAGEECDDGNDIDTDACPTTCRNAACGDGFVWAGTEACERGQRLSCTAACGIPGEGPCSDLCTAPAAEACVPLSGTCCDPSQCPSAPGCSVSLCPAGTCQLGPAADRTTCTGGICCAGICRPGGECCVSDDCRSCRGTAAACSDLPDFMCWDQDGCSAVFNDPYCYESSSSCTSFTDDVACSTCGCTWDGTALACSGSGSSCPSYTDGATCTGCGCTWGFPQCQEPSTRSCGSFSTPETCDACEGCYWSDYSSSCRGGSIDCNDIFDAASCSSACGCTWFPECEGTARACSTFTSGWSCNDQEGCDWFNTCSAGYVCVD